MAGEVYNLAILLSVKDQSSKGLDSYTKTLKGLETQGKKTIAVLKDFEKLSGKKLDLSKGLSNFVKDLNNTQKETKQTLSYIKSLQNTISKGFPVKGEKIADSVKVNKTSGKSRNYPNTPDESSNVIKPPKRRNKNLLSNLSDFNEKYIEPTRQVGETWKREYDTLKEYTEEARKLALSQAKFKLINLSPEENTKAFDAVTKSVRSMGITTRSEGIEVLTDLHTALGDLDHAIEALPLASKYRFGMETLFGDKFSDEELERQIQNSYKFLELTGKVAKGREEMEKSFNVIAQISSSTGGRLTGVDFLNMGKTGGTAVQGLTPEGMRNISAIMQELGGDRTGTSLMSLYQALVGGVMKQSAAERFAYFGLVDKSKIEYGKGQKIKRLLPGANKLGDPMMSDPLTAADMLKEAMRKKGVKVDDEKEVNKELAVLFQNRNAQRLISILINQRSQVLKEANLAKNAKDVEGLFKLASEGDLGKLKLFEKAIKEFKTEAGIPLIQIGTKVAQTLLPIMRFFGDHPTITQWALAAILAGKGLKTISETASILKSSGALSSLFSGAASNANKASDSIKGATSQVGGFKSALGGIASTLAVSVIVGYSLKRLGDVEEFADKKEANAKSASDSYRDWLNYRKDLESRGLKPSAADYQKQSNLAWDTSLSSGLKDSLPASRVEGDKFISYKNFWESTVGKATSLSLANAADPTGLMTRLQGGTNDFNGWFGGGAAKGFKTNAPQLNNPNIMASFLQQIPQKLKYPVEQDQVRAGVKEAYPESYAKAMEILNKQSGQLSESFKGLTDQANLQKQNAEVLKIQGEGIKEFSIKLSDLQKPIGDTNQNLYDLATQSGNTKSSLYNLLIAVNGVSSGLNSASNKLSNWQPPQGQTPTIPLGNTVLGNISNNQNGLLPKINLGGGNAVGGTVNSKGLAYIHANEDIVPASVSQRYKQPLGISSLMALSEFVENNQSFWNVLDSAKQQENKSGVNEFSRLRDVAKMQSRQRLENPVAERISEGQLSRSNSDKNKSLSFSYSPTINIPKGSDSLTREEIQTILEKDREKAFRELARLLKDGSDRS